MAAQAKIGETEARAASLRDEQAALGVQALAADQAVSKLLGELQREEALLTRATHASEQLAIDAVSAAQRAGGGRGGGGGSATAAAAAAARRGALGELEEAVEADRGALEANARQAGSELATHGLTAAERERTVALQAAQAESMAALEGARAVRAELEAKVLRVESRLRDDLSRATANLEAELERLRAAQAPVGVAERRDELAGARRAAAECDAAAQRHEAELAARADEERTLEAALEEARGASRAAASVQASEAAGLDKALTRRNLLTAKLDEHVGAIRAIGSLPRDAATDVDASASSRALLEQVERLHKQLRKYSHVNKKALDQYHNFAEQREALIERKAAVDKGAESISELIAHLDAQKDAALERTFKDVALHFATVFAELVPGGAGSLEMLTEPQAGGGDEGEGDDEDDEDEEGSDARACKRPALQKYSGVSIKVRFAGGGDTQTLGQLSGGQKTMVALCLVFAIQRMCKQACASVCKRVQASVCKQACASKRVQASVCKHVQACAYKRMQACAYKRMQACASVCKQACASVCKRVQACASKRVQALAAYLPPLPRTALTSLGPCGVYHSAASGQRTQLLLWPPSIDANLDAAHRDAVARMVHRQANKDSGSTQFITTTFRPELVQSADRHCGVSVRNRMSTISPITMERALSIIKEEQSVQQQRA
ncbi:hypothetical protein T492DRAFT_838749 [Pavlovales sp. CCMP2436]|nr:hypothetical protein T492DRAFT_838749 [Pavlovales sp. CCMP2436]